MNHQELIERLRAQDGMSTRNKLIADATDAIESLLAENERLKHNLAVTEQTMREYQELAAKRLEEIERLKTLCTTMDGQLGKRPCQNNRCLEYNRLQAELAKYRDAPVVASARSAFAELSALQADNATAWAQAHRLALELECLLLDTKDNASVSKWWDSGMEALDEYQRTKPCAKEEAEAWAKMRKVTP